MRIVFVLLLFFNLGFVPDRALQDEDLEARAQNLISQLRCFVCEGQPLAQSNVRLAQDLRHLVRKLIKQGKSDRAVLEFIAKRYGDDVLLNTPWALHTAFLWLLPFGFLTLIGFVFWRLFFRKTS
jgi:cytochrome c-type biogenesis protein CcmH